MGMDLRVVPAEEWWNRGRDSSHDGERDLGLMVTDFLETGVGSGGAGSWCSSDSDSGFPDPSYLSDKIQYLKYSMAQHETEVLSAVRTLMLTIKEKDLHSVKSGTCNASCIRFYLAKLLRLSGYDAAVCSARWQGGGKVPGGDNEYIDIILSDSEVGQDDRLIVDIDFRSHFEIARAVDSYQRIMESLPVVYVGTVARLNQFLQVMVDAAKFSLKQNSMPLPPWRSLNYLRSKWHSPHKRHLGPIDQQGPGMFSPGLHGQCAENLKRLQFALQVEQESERFMKKKSGFSRRNKPEIMRIQGALAP
ncbi:PDDEXK-like [Arabidopsis thaliana x Arabidopsis arenosa]|uniref:PDDEXK-like n=1 Tax=Arabidopsis thaliana x Arabidopsis arenosa TaxID=1240361 RepID=A0A8T2AAN2_9BRAS|nr:PDDEXK-like [Arabidopsis thaliana x Arabidopsis arenosa]